MTATDDDNETGAMTIAKLKSVNTRQKYRLTDAGQSDPSTVSR